MGLTMDDIRECLQRADTSSRPRITGQRIPGHYNRKPQWRVLPYSRRLSRVNFPTMEETEEFDVELVVSSFSCTGRTAYIPWEPVIVKGVMLRVAIDDKGIVYIADKATVIDKKMFPKRVIV